MSTPTPARRRWFQFSLRTRLVAVTVVALLAGWVGYSLNWIHHRRRFLDEFVMYVSGEPPEEQPRAPGLLWLFGESGYSIIGLLDFKRDAREAKHLFPEAEIQENIFDSIRIKDVQQP